MSDPNMVPDDFDYYDEIDDEDDELDLMEDCGQGPDGQCAYAGSEFCDWVKGQVTAIETGIMSFSAVFLPHMIAADGRPMLEHLTQQGLLPAPVEG